MLVLREVTFLINMVKTTQRCLGLVSESEVIRWRDILHG